MAFLDDPLVSCHTGNVGATSNLWLFHLQRPALASAGDSAVGMVDVPDDQAPSTQGQMRLYFLRQVSGEMTEADFGGKFRSSFRQLRSDGEVRGLVPTSAHEDGGLSSRASPGWAWKVPLGKWNAVSPLLGPT